MEQPENDDQMRTAPVQAVDLSSDVNKPYQLEMEEENSEVAGVGSQDKCDWVAELVESCDGVEGDGAVVLEDKPVAVGGGGEVVGAPSDDPPLGIKVEEEAKNVDEGCRDAVELFAEGEVETVAAGELLVDVKSEQELLPVVEAKLGTEVGDVAISPEPQIDAGGDELLSSQQTMKVEEDAIVSDVGDAEKTNRSSTDVRRDEFQAAGEGVESSDYKSEKVVAELVDCLGVENHGGTLVGDDEVKGVLANYSEVETAEAEAPAGIRIPVVKTDVISEVNACAVDVNLQKQVNEFSGFMEYAANDVRCDPVAGFTFGSDLLEDKDTDLEFLENSKLDEPVNERENLDDAAVLEEASPGDIEKEKEVEVELDSPRNAVMEEIDPMEKEETPSDVNEPGQDECDDALAAPQDEEVEKMVDEEAEAQDTVMENETDIMDPGKTSGGKRKRVKVSKSPITKVTVKGSAKKKVGEDVCFICFEGGELVICDRRGCPKAYHLTCVNRDEAFFKSKGRWNCGWHLCSICEKSARYMCYTCTFSLCRSCTKDAVILCVRGNKGFCETCMTTIMLIENDEQENNDTQIDFDNKNSWEHLFKNYYMDLKAKLSLSLVEITGAKNRWKGADISGSNKPESQEALDDANDGGSCSDDSNEISEATKPKKRKVRKQSKSVTKEDELMVTGNDDAVGNNISLSEKPDWASKELLEFVSHMKDGVTSALTQFEVQALLLEYIKRNKLRDPRRKSQIICDPMLENLFRKSRVGHFEMLKLLESHFLIKDEQNDDVQGSVVDVENSLVTDGNTDLLTKDAKDRKRKSRKKGNSRGPQSNLDDYAAIDMHNIGLIYLRRKLMEDLLEDADAFPDKVIGTFVRIRISGITQRQDLYRLVPVLGTRKAPESYKIGKKSTYIMVEILNLDKAEIIQIDTISNQEFSEDECKRLRQSIKCGLISRLTVGEILDKTLELQAVKVNDWLESETMRLSHLRDRASDLGHRKELRECVEKLALLKNPEERQRRLDEIPEIHADPKMDPSYESEDKDSEPEDSRQDAFARSRSSSFNQRGRMPISPGIDNSVKDSWNAAGKVLTKTWELSRDLSSYNFSNIAGHNGNSMIENSSTSGRDLWRQDSRINSAAIPEPAEWAAHSATLGRDVGRQETKISSAAISEQAEWASCSVTLGRDVGRQESRINSAPIPEPAEQAPRSVTKSDPPPVVTSINPQAYSPAKLVESYVKINESQKMWHYQDPSGKVQGPFSMMQLRKWNKSGYFPADLKIWRTTERQVNAMRMADALAGKIPKESPAVDTVDVALAGHPNDASVKFSHQNKERPNTNQISGSLPKASNQKLLGNDVPNLPSPTPTQINTGTIGVEGRTVTGNVQTPNEVLSSPTPVLPTASTIAFGSTPNFQSAGPLDSAVSRYSQSNTVIEAAAVQMHSNPQAAPQPAQNRQPNQGWAVGPQPGQPQGYGWGGSNVQNPSGSFSNSGTPSGPQPDVWRPTQSSQPNMYPPPVTPDASWGPPAGNNAAAPMGVRPDNPNYGWGQMPANPNMGWVNPPTANQNMNWGSAMPPAQGNTPGWVAPPGNAVPSPPGMVPANPNPGWAPAQTWGAPPPGQVQGNNGWGMPGGNGGGPPPLAQGPGPGNGWGTPSGTPGGPPPPAQGPPPPLPPLAQGAPPRGNVNQGWVGPPGNQGPWNGEPGQFSGQRGGPRGGDPGFNGGRRMNRQSSGGRVTGGRGPPRYNIKRQEPCPYLASGFCVKGDACNYIHS